MKVYYEETYGGYYEVDEKIPEKAKERLYEDLLAGREDGPDNCVGSIIVPIVGNGHTTYQEMGAKIDAMDENEKKFYLWHLLRYYYKKSLVEDKEKHKRDHASVDQLDRLIANVEEIDTLLVYDLF